MSDLDAPEQNDARIYYTGAAFGGSMMGQVGERSWLTCASCHGPEGRGGPHAMHLTVMKAPDIHYAALATMPELKGRHSLYGLDDFRRQFRAVPIPTSTGGEWVSRQLVCNYRRVTWRERQTLRMSGR